MLENVKNLLSDGVTALGGILIVFGLVNLGLTIKDGIRSSVFCFGLRSPSS